MPPQSTFDKFLQHLVSGLEDAATDFLKDVNKQARRNLQAAERASRVIPKSKKRPQGSSQAVPPASPRMKEVRPSPTAYDVLEVSPKASPETVSAAFRSLSARFHPDNKKTGNEAKYKDITAAWSVLKDPTKRKEYNRKHGL